MNELKNCCLSVESSYDGCVTGATIGINTSSLIGVTLLMRLLASNRTVLLLGVDLCGKVVISQSTHVLFPGTEMVQDDKHEAYLSNGVNSGVLEYGLTSSILTLALIKLQLCEVRGVYLVFTINPESFFSHFQVSITGLMLGILCGCLVCNSCFHTSSALEPSRAGISLLRIDDFNTVTRMGTGVNNPGNNTFTSI